MASCLGRFPRLVDVHLRASRYGGQPSMTLAGPARWAYQLKFDGVLRRPVMGCTRTVRPMRVSRRSAKVGTLNASLRDLVHSVKAQRLEGLVAKRRDSRYEPGLRSGAWMKMRVNQGQESAGSADLRRRRGDPGDCHAGRCVHADAPRPTDRASQGATRRVRRETVVILLPPTRK